MNYGQVKTLIYIKCSRQRYSKYADYTSSDTFKKEQNYASICIISKLAKDKVSSEGKGLTENRHYAPLAIIRHTLLQALLSSSKRKRYKTLGETI